MSLKEYQSEVLDRYEVFLHAWRAQAEANSRHPAGQPVGARAMHAGQFRLPHSLPRA